MTAGEILEYDRRRVWHPYASLSNPPRARLAARTEGIYIETADGGRLIDGVASWWCAAHGHGHPAIVEAIRRQARTMSHVMFGGFTHGPAVELADRIAAIAPEGLRNVFFADSGSISVEVAVKMAIQYQQAKGRPRRCKMVALEGGYHGDTACAMALSDPDGMHTLFKGMMPRHFFAPKPEGDAGIWAEELEKTIDAHKDEIAGVICEPILQAANAMHFYGADFLRAMRRICDERDLVLVFDEIAAGFHRTGPLWAHSRAADAAPDVMCIGKALTGGHVSLAAAIASDKTADAISRGNVGALMHGPTYMANPLACAAANASLELFAAGGYEEKVHHAEEVFKKRLAGVERGGNVRDVRVLGAVAVVETGRLPERDAIDRVIDGYGVWLRPFANFIYAMPPLVCDDAALSRIADAIAAMAALPPGREAAGDFHE